MKVSKVLIEQDEIEQKVKELAERINKDYSGEELVIVGILKGAFIVISDLAKQLNVDVTFEFMSIQSYEGTKSTGQIKIDKNLSQKFGLLQKLNMKSYGFQGLEKVI